MFLLLKILRTTINMHKQRIRSKGRKIDPKKHKILYMVTINSGGLLHDRVYKLMKKEDLGWYDTPVYYDKSGDFGFEYEAQLGLNKKRRYWIFVAETKKRSSAIFRWCCGN